MNAQQENILDDAILLALSANHTRFGLGAGAIRLQARAFGGGRATEEEVAGRLEYLTEKGLAEEVDKTVHKSLRAWKISDGGRRYLDEHNL
jgi:hypothetical protein